MNANEASRKDEQRDNEICLMARKPCSLRDLKEQIDREITPMQARKLTGNHKVVTGEFKDWADFYAADFSANQWWEVTLEKERVRLLIDTQGYVYPRYAGILQNAKASGIRGFTAGMHKMERTPKNKHAILKKENEKLLKLIGAELEKQTPENPHYGDVGDLEHTKRLLIEILCFQRDAFDELDIERELLD